MQKEFLTVKELYRQKEEYIGKTVKVAGWIRTSRLSKNFGFIELNDGSFFKNMQIVLDEKLENFIKENNISWKLASACESINANNSTYNYINKIGVQQVSKLLEMNEAEVISYIKAGS